MAGFLNIGEMSALALHATARLAAMEKENPGVRISVAELAKNLGSSQHTLHKVITRLVGAELVDTARGPAGGVKLAKPAELITVLAIVEAVDGKIMSNGCMFSPRGCPAGKPCAFPGLTCGLESRIRDYFQNTTLPELIAPHRDSHKEKEA